MRRDRSRHAAVEQPRAEVAANAPAVTDESVSEGGQRLGERLVHAGLVSREDVVSALAESQQNGKRLGRVLVDRGVIDEEELTIELAAQLNVPMVDFRTVSPSADALALMNETTARSLAVIPLAIDGDLVHVAMADPTPAAVERVRGIINRQVFPVIAPPSDLQRAISSCYRATSAVDSQVRAFEIRDNLRREESQRLDTATASDEAPVVQVVQSIITQGLRDRASDIHVEPSDDRVRVRYRIDGALHDVLTLPNSIGPAVVSRVKILAGLNIVERRRSQDGQISMDVDGRDVDIRVSTTAIVGGEKLVMRLLDKSRPLYALTDLGMPDATTKTYESLLRSPYGMVICAGPTGSGKTTTLYASLSELNSPERNIMTIEDPVEYTFPTINQIQINEQAGITFANGLRSILRQDPDIILVGEVRDVDTARIAVQSALTGHFVLSSLHATDAVAALYRLIDMGIEGFLVASSVTAVVSQRLVRRNCPYCIGDYTPPPEEMAFFGTFGGTAPPGGFVRGAGCNFCSQTGYLDRIGVYELLPISDEVRELIVDRGSHDELRKLARLQGMHTLQEESVRLIENGITTIPEVMRSIYVAGM